MLLENVTENVTRNCIVHYSDVPIHIIENMESDIIEIVLMTAMTVLFPVVVVVVVVVVAAATAAA